MQLDDRIDNLVGSALFADGSGAMIIGSVPRQDERVLFEMHRNVSKREIVEIESEELCSDEIYAYVIFYSLSYFLILTHVSIVFTNHT